MSQDARDQDGARWNDGVYGGGSGEGPNHPDNAAIAHEAAAIYPDTHAGRPTPEEIATEAYRIYLGRGESHGRDFEDWLEAERRLSRTNEPGRSEQ
jgi:hypothetical protein